ncbi:hypothetical protein ACP4OV_020126 [Aristida adscensionis]
MQDDMWLLLMVASKTELGWISHVVPPDLMLPAPELEPLLCAGRGNEINFCGLYLYHTYLGSNATQSTIISQSDIGNLVVNNWVVRDGLGPNAKSSPVHRACTSMPVFQGSTLQVMGIPVEGGDWAIVGGTGKFAMATGVINKRVHEKTADGNIIELTIQGFCPQLKGSRCVATKVGPWGGNGGSAQDIKEAPRRLESITIRSGSVVDSIAFSYVDQDGQKRTAGPWGGPGGNPNTIQLAPSEFVKEVSGTFGVYNGVNAINSIKFVTNMKTYGPFGLQQGTTPFSVPVQNNCGVVGFFARSNKYLEAIGVYVLPL